MSILSNGDNAEQVIRKAIREGRSRLDGNSYIPAAVIEDYNRKFGTAYQETDIEFEL